MLRNVRQNLRYSLRLLRRKPGFTAMAVLTLALGIGATTAIFSVIYATLFEPMPYPNPDQLVMVWSKVDEGRNSVSAGDYLEWKRRSTSFQNLVAWSGNTFNVATAERPEQVDAAVMTPGFFSMLGEPMFLGRDFLPEELAGALHANKIDASIAVQADQLAQETLFLLDLAKRSRSLVSVFGPTNNGCTNARR